MPGISTHVHLAVPTITHGPLARVSWNWINAYRGINMPLGSSLGSSLRVNMPIAQARNELCQEAIDVGADYLFFLSDDVLPPGNVIIAMLDKIGREFPVENGQMARASMITGTYWTKTQPIEPYFWMGSGLKGSYRDWKVGEFFPLDLAGMDCCLIDVQALKEVPRPWFSTDWIWNDEEKPSSIATEDFYFYRKMRKYGHRLFADTSIQCFHEDRSTGELFSLTMDMYQAGGIPPFGENEYLVAELGSGSSAPYLGPNCKIVRFDLRDDVRPDVRCDLLHIPEFHFGKYDRVRAQHVLEHFTRQEAPQAVAHWARLLKPGGKIIINLPNLEWAMSKLADNADKATPQERLYAKLQLYGDQAYGPASWHKNGFTRRTLWALMSIIPGLTDITVEPTEEDGINLTATATLSEAQTYESIGTWWKEIEEREGKPFPQAWEEMQVEIVEGPKEETPPEPASRGQTVGFSLPPTLTGNAGNHTVVADWRIREIAEPVKAERPKRSHKKKVQDVTK